MIRFLKCFTGKNIPENICYALYIYLSKRRHLYIILTSTEPKFNTYFIVIQNKTKNLWSLLRFNAILILISLCKHYLFNKFAFNKYINFLNMILISWIECDETIWNFTLREENIQISVFCFFFQMEAAISSINNEKVNTAKPAHKVTSHKVTSFKQSPVLKGQFFLIWW